MNYELSSENSRKISRAADLVSGFLAMGPLKRGPLETRLIVLEHLYCKSVLIYVRYYETLK